MILRTVHKFTNCLNYRIMQRRWKWISEPMNGFEHLHSPGGCEARKSPRYEFLELYLNRDGANPTTIRRERCEDVDEIDEMVQLDDKSMEWHRLDSKKAAGLSCRSSHGVRKSPHDSEQDLGQYGNVIGLIVGVVRSPPRNVLTLIWMNSGPSMFDLSRFSDRNRGGIYECDTSGLVSQRRRTFRDTNLKAFRTSEAACEADLSNWVETAVVNID